ncbi:hypothetical protein I6J18_03305 [Peribacillus psychrosaccharolyticus]|uniref:Uncharacterized protein n=1 Tax=Peribacillus psychrosaccharolyticus TaxID=1407 RepID=A0A974NN67_PERPY|nr:hypothetical protein [Peribacillus psychrosaccharolyticus]MEC2055817.1 hypothetical protein [Peribacillus psychrosaccharolyticus]MED3742992.1 hypothetical protein [Peribacillus psychrosaccharolyticus]QQT00950.1 hypothetical protein I6J18_03305 [Peribacillus psychrosaccharolyticus]
MKKPVDKLYLLKALYAAIISSFIYSSVFYFKGYSGILVFLQFTLLVVTPIYFLFGAPLFIWMKQLNVSIFRRLGLFMLAGVLPGCFILLDGLSFPQLFFSGIVSVHNTAALLLYWLVIELLSGTFSKEKKRSL